MKKKFPLIFLSVLISIIFWISVSLSGEYYYTLTVPMKLINIPKGLAVSSRIPDKASIKIRGKGWKILSYLLSTDNPFVVSVQEENNHQIILRNSISENAWLTNDVNVVEIIPNSIKVSFDRTIEGKRKVIGNWKFSFKEGYGLARPVALRPDSVEVLASKKLLAEITTIGTIPKEFVELDKAFTEIIPLETINGVIIKPEAVEAFFDVQKIVDKEFTNIPVEVRNIPPDRTVILIPNEITVSAKGGIELLARAQSNEFIAWIEYRDIVADTLGTIEPNIQLPPFLQLNYLNPERLRFIIKKY